MKNRSVGSLCWVQGKPISITCSECVFVPIVIQHAKRLRRIILPPVDCLDLQYFPHIIS